MTFTGVPAENQKVASSNLLEADLDTAFERAAHAVGDGQRRSWDLPEDQDAAATANRVARWLRQLLAVPWCLDETSVDAVCEQFDQLVADGVPPGRVEVLCHAVMDHRRPTVYLAVSAWSDGALQPPSIARVDAVVGGAS